jgi:hypothetical protein
MKSKLIAAVTFLLFSIVYAVDNGRYILINGGGGNGFSADLLVDNQLLDVSAKWLAGGSIQGPLRKQTSWIVTGLCHSWMIQPPSNHQTIETFYPTISLEVAIKLPFFKKNIGQYTQLQIYGKPGGWVVGTPIKFKKEPTSFYTGAGALVGGGMQFELFSNTLIDVSVNGLFSCLNVKNTWFIRVGIGPRF